MRNQSFFAYTFRQRYDILAMTRAGEFQKLCVDRILAALFEWHKPREKYLRYLAEQRQGERTIYSEGATHEWHTTQRPSRRRSSRASPL
jgi:hypothetical protein